MVKKPEFSWRDEPEMIDRLTRAQNGIRANVDVMTFAGLCESREQLEAHVIACEEKAADYRSSKRRSPKST
jgi:hypothetical protein